MVNTVIIIDLRKSTGKHAKSFLRMRSNTANPNRNGKTQASAVFLLLNENFLFIRSIEATT